MIGRKLLGMFGAAMGMGMPPLSWSDSGLGSGLERRFCSEGDYNYLALLGASRRGKFKAWRDRK